MAALCVALPLMMANPSLAQGLVPADFFNAPISENGSAAVEADTLTYDVPNATISASGTVILRYEGYEARGPKLVYNRASNEVAFEGAVSLRDPSGNLLETDNLEVTGGMKKAFLNAMTITAYDGARITAESVDYDQALQTLLTNASYAPCEDCIDDKGRRVGWKVTAKRFIYTKADDSVYLDQPVLELLGLPVAWLPFLLIPNLGDFAVDRVRTPTIDFSPEIGVKLAVPIVAYSTAMTDIILTPTLLSRQGFLLGTEWQQRFDNGALEVSASELYQADREAFAGEVGDRDFRGSIQTTGRFTPVENWTVGWAYTKFSDAAYFEDYRISDADSSINEVYAQYLTEDKFFDARLQQFNLLGQVTEFEQTKQAAALPNIRFEQIKRLGEGQGQIELSGRLLGVDRDRDYLLSTNGVRYDEGYEGRKNHLMLQAGWQNQIIAPGGFVATPYLGVRGDAAYYDGSNSDNRDDNRPGEGSLFSATPIAAMDVRFPLAAQDGSTTHLIEPVVQIVYRGSDTSIPGINNDNAQSFVFEDTNLFSYNRFSGTDRQETGLRANIGGRYQANFADGGYIEVIAGQSFQLAGNNAFADADPARAGQGSGLDVTPSYGVLGAYGSFMPGISFGGKLQVDTQDPGISRAGLEAKFEQNGYSLLGRYQYIAADDDLGVQLGQQEIGAEFGLPLMDYWTLKAGGYWDIASNSFLLASTAVEYDDGFLVLGAGATITGPTHTSPDDTRFIATFRLKAPAGLDFGFSGGVPGL